jgi:Raf kinase inhibitor-like YbhB/YbcL family protein
VIIPAEATALKKDAGKVDGSNLPPGAMQVNTDFGGPGWGGPCPPEGDRPHRYQFSLYALKVPKLELPPNATASLAGFMVNANSLGKATLTGRYGRKK